MAKSNLKPKRNGSAQSIDDQLNSQQVFQLAALTAPFVHEAFQPSTKERP